MKLFILFSLLLFSLQLSAQKGYDIAINMNLDGEQTLYLAYHYGDKQYIAAEDTSTIGQFNFKGEEKLAPGVYKLVLKENTQVLEIVVINQDQHFTITSTRPPYFVRDAQVTGSLENEAYYNLAKEKFRLLLNYRALQEKSKYTQGKQKEEAEKDLKAITDSAQHLQSEFILNHPTFLVSKALKANIPIRIPTADELGLSQEKYEQQRIELYKKHYFDNLDLKEAGLIRTDVFYPLITGYLNTLYLQDSIQQKEGLTRLLDTLKVNPEMYKFTLIEMVNNYAKVNSFHGAAIYAFLVEEYYLKGKADWVDAITLQNMRKSVEKIRRTELGKIAPPITLPDHTGKEVNRQDIKSKYKILVFWSSLEEESLGKLQELKLATETLPKTELQVYAVDKGGNHKSHFQKLNDHQLTNAENWVFTLGAGDLFKEDYTEVYRNYGDFYYLLLDADNKIIMRGNSLQPLLNAL
ncbi:AhpC/TSA family protein [Lishizhenia tianjinensis]|uniref:AhpC/TSA family protein n=1 Tax=Lishizhenia tianjinensis TaxID=477690 RepID=A0A1I7BKF6_9FLAO|nr:DUF5106 domain-containing protein [Lishizhenia tianjinensis]SFT87659.1 AhpC/TSA family protein [Lishizhenia tianjinensis]